MDSENRNKILFRSYDKWLSVAVYCNEGDKWLLYNGSDVYIGSIEINHNREYSVVWHYTGLCEEEDIEFVQYVLSTLNKETYTPLGHYVYLVFVEEELKYIGKGVDDRYLHCTSGASHKWQLNKSLYTGEQIEVYLMLDSMTYEDALRVESSMIRAWYDGDAENLYNTKGAVGWREDWPQESRWDLYTRCKNGMRLLSGVNLKEVCVE